MKRAYRKVSPFLLPAEKFSPSLSLSAHPRYSHCQAEPYQRYTNQPVDQPLALDFAYGAFMSFAHWLWFSLVAVFFSSTALRKAMIDRQVLVDRVIGLALIGLGLAVAVTGIR